jgi:hypothetical protein
MEELPKFKILFYQIKEKSSYLPVKNTEGEIYLKLNETQFFLEQINENDQNILYTIPFEEITEFNFGSYEKSIDKGKFVIKVVANIKTFFLKTSKEDYVRLRNLLSQSLLVQFIRKKDGKQERKTFLDFSYKWRNRMKKLEKNHYLLRFFELLVIDKKCINEDQFYRVALNQKFDNLFIRKENSSEYYTIDKLKRKSTMKGLKINYFVPEIWNNNQEVFTVCNKDNTTLTQTTLIPQLDKVNGLINVD